MAEPLRFHPQVAADLAAATQWYDDISVELGNRFRRALNACFDSLALRPRSFGCVQGEQRAARVAGFPYLVVFEFRDPIAEVLGVFHSASDPSKWGDRKR